MGKPSAPAPPDYAGAAVAQGAANVNSALATNYLNQPNQVGPTGSLTYSYDNQGGNTLPDGTVIPRTTVTTQLSPEQQRLYDQNNQISQALNNTAIRGIDYVDRTSSQPIDLNSLPSRQRIPGSDDFAAQRDGVTNALMARINPQIDRDRVALDSKLSNQGIFAGSEAYGTAKTIQGQQENDQRTQAYLAGSQEQGRMFNQGLAASQATDAQRSQGLQEQDYIRNQPINVLNALRTGNQVQMPEFGNRSTGAQIAAAPIYAATSDRYNAQMQQYQSQMQGFQSLLGGLGSLGSAAIMSSDRRLKENLKKIGEKSSGLPVYTFNYIGDPTEQIGCIADEVEKIFPEAVSYRDDGYAQVDYRMVG